jgi:surface antigen
LRAEQKTMASRIFLITVTAALLAAAHSTPVRAEGENQFFGTVTGAIAGGIIGNQFGHGNGRVAATAAGVIAGGWIGNDIGYSLDNSRAAPSSGGPRALLPSGGAPILNGAYTPNYVAPDDDLMPASVYDDSRGSYCRAYSEQVRIGDQVQENYGTACLQPDGTWHAVDEE